jgi:ABC-2 type transport system permease protein
MFFFVLIFMLLSGLFTPIASMPKWAQYLTYVNPPRYLIEVLRLLYLKGGCFADIRLHFFALLGFDVLFAAWAALSYKKQN